MKCHPKNIPGLKYPLLIYLSTKAKKIIRGKTIYVSIFPPRFMLKMGSAFFNVEIIRGFASNFVAIYYAASHPFGFPSRSKSQPLDIQKHIYTKLRNQDKKLAFIRVYEDVSLARSSEFMKICHNMNSIVHTTGGYASSLNGKSESPNETLDNITRYILLNSSCKKELWCFANKYAIWISQQTKNRLYGDVSYLLRHGTRPSYKHIKIWSMRVYTINGRATRNNFDDRSHRGYFMGYAATTGVIL